MIFRGVERDGGGFAGEEDEPDREGLGVNGGQRSECLK